jgi:hypothetical protein
MFQSDTDLDIACDLPKTLGLKEEEWEHSFAELVNQSDILHSVNAIAFYSSAAYAYFLAEDIVPYIRDKLDTDGLGEKLFEICRTEEESFWDNEYQTLIFGAIVMRAGAGITPEHREYLRLIADNIEMAPARAQFLAAVDHYQPGIPRSFQVKRSVSPGK